MLAFPRKPCAICGQPLTVHQAIHGFCDSSACRIAIGRRRLAQRHEEEKAAVQAVANAHRDALLAAQPHLQARGLDVFAVPGLEAVMQPASPERVATLRAHLDEVLSEAVANSQIAPSQDIEQPADRQTNDRSSTQRSADAEKVVAAACATCRGYCCRKGGDSAYLRAETIVRVRADHPELTDDALFAAYINAVPLFSAVGSCIFHGERGCTLPRDFRADICNTFHCPPLEAWLVSESNAHVAAIFVSETKVERETVVVRSD